MEVISTSFLGRTSALFQGIISFSVQHKMEEAFQGFDINEINCSASELLKMHTTNYSFNIKEKRRFYS